jgi:hypothetical protein
VTFARTAVLVLTIETAILPANATDHPQNTTHKQRLSGTKILKRPFGKQSMIRLGAGAAFSHALNKPHEWGRGIGGFGKRVGSGLGFHVIKSSVQYTVGAIRHEELGYRPSDKQGFKPRLTHALVSTVITRKTDSGRQTMASGRISGALTAGMVSRLWMPVRLHTVSSGFSSAGISLGLDASMNVVREFWPEIRRRRRPAPVSQTDNSLVQ